MSPTEQFREAVEAALEDYRRMFTEENGGYMDKEQALASIQAATVELFTRLVGEDEPIPIDILQFGDDDQRKYWQNKLRQELRQKIDQLIKDLRDGHED